MKNFAYSCLRNQEYKLRFYKLLPLNLRDIEKIRKWRNDQIKVLRQKNFISRIDQKKYFDKNIFEEMKFKNPQNILFGFYYKKKIIGYGGLVHINWQNQFSEVSFLLDTKNTKSKRIYQMHFSNFIKIIRIIAFKKLFFKKIYTETYSFRIHHISILEKNNFKKLNKFKYIKKINNSKISKSIFHELKNAA